MAVGEFRAGIGAAAEIMCLARFRAARVVPARILPAHILPTPGAVILIRAAPIVAVRAVAIILVAPLLAGAGRVAPAGAVAIAGFRREIALAAASMIVTITLVPAAGIGLAISAAARAAAEAVLVAPIGTGPIVIAVPVVLGAPILRHAFLLLWIFPLAEKTAPAPRGSGKEGQHCSNEMQLPRVLARPVKGKHERGR
ncbi:MAG: hypothetical protein B7Z41_05035 [Rhizobiales bacterium 12-66-7]|nr:MAG: hypothetical protein B7Z41_05035 [Rhizobiales bacterium 12-66-7]